MSGQNQINNSQYMFGTLMKDIIVCNFNNVTVVNNADQQRETLRTSSN